MPTYSTNLSFILPNDGEYSGTWGQIMDLNMGTLIEQSISGYVTQAITDGADTVITIPLGASGVARNMFIEGTGALSATRNLIVPTNKKLYYFYNNTTGGQSVVVKVAGQTGVTVPPTGKALLVCNGTDVVTATNFFGSVDINGGTIDGTVIGGTTPAAGSFTNVSVTSSTIPINGLYLPAANTVAIASATTQRWKVDGVGQHTIIAPTAAGATLIINSQATDTTNTINLSTAGAMIRFSRSSDGSPTGFVGSRSGTSSFSVYNTGGTTSELEAAGGTINIKTNSVTRISAASNGQVSLSGADAAGPTLTVAAPATSGVTASFSGLAASNVLSIDSSLGNVSPIKFVLNAASSSVFETSTGNNTGGANAQITSGTVLSANKPGGNNTVFHWMKVTINGTVGYIPIWGA